MGKQNEDLGARAKFNPNEDVSSQHDWSDVDAKGRQHYGIGHDGESKVTGLGLDLERRARQNKNDNQETPMTRAKLRKAPNRLGLAKAMLARPYKRLNARRRAEMWGYGEQATSTASSDTYYTALESMSSEGESTRKSNLRETEVTMEPEEEQTNFISMRRPLMYLLVIANESVMLAFLIYLMRWLVNYRGGVSFLEALWPENQREPQFCVNLHAASMSFCFVALRPQTKIVKILMENKPEKRQHAVEVCVHMASVAAFVLGLQQIWSVDEVFLPPRWDGPDIGIHLIMSGAAITVYLLSLVNALAKALGFYAKAEKTIFLAYLVSVLQDSHFIETLFQLLEFIGFLALLTGFLAYILLISTAADYDLTKAFPIALQTGDEAGGQEDDAFLTAVLCLTFTCLTSVCIVFYQHNVLYHSGIITYQMYKNNFKEIADAVARGGDTEAIVQEMTDIECLAQYEKNETSSRANMERASERELSRRPATTYAASKNVIKPQN